jgi:phosphotriesterase-related protein
MITDGLIEERVPEWNFTHIPTSIVPMLKGMGVSNADIEQMTVKNPRAIFENNAAY